MLTSEDQEAIISFIFSQDRYQELALAVLGVRQQITEKIIKEFSEKLTEKLNMKVKEIGDSWVINNYLGTERYSGIKIYKNAWVDSDKALYGVTLEVQDSKYRQFAVGVWNNRDVLGEDYDDGSIKDSLKVCLPKGWKNPWWPCCIFLQDPYRNWAEPTTLSRFIGNQREHSVDVLATRMLDIAKSAEVVIDSMVDKFRNMQPRV